MFMKSEGLILASVLGVCALFGVGVSQVAAPAVTQTVESVSHGITGIAESSGTSTDSQSSLRESLAAHYPKADITDEQLESLSCGEADWMGNKDCYKGATDKLKEYGTANIIMDGKVKYVHLISTPAGAFLK
jgi:hypothetical protein